MKSYKIILIILGILITGLIGCFVYLAKDEPLSNDDDLRLSRIEISEKENAFYSLTQASEKIYWPEKKAEAELVVEIIKNKKWNLEFVEKLLKKNKEALDLLTKIRTFSKFQDPECADPGNVSMVTPSTSVLGDFRRIAMLNSVKALYLFKQEKEEEAFNVTMDTIRLGHLIQESQGSLIDYLVGISIKETGLENLRIIIKNTTLTSAVLKNYIKELDKFKASEESLVNALKMEYTMVVNSLPTLTAEDIVRIQTSEELLTGEEISAPFSLRIASKFPYFYKPNKTRRIIAESYRELISNVSKDYREISEIKHLAPSPPSVKFLLTENIIGRILHDTVVIALEGIFSRKCEEDFSVTGTQLLLAIKGYQIKNGKIITSLDILVPEYLFAVPKDPFDGRPIRFSLEKKIIYSVGSDLKDSGGSEGEDWRKMSDPTFQIELQ